MIIAVDQQSSINVHIRDTGRSTLLCLHYN